MATSPSPFSLKLFPPTSSYPSSPSLYFLIAHPQTHTSNNFRSVKLKLSSSHGTIQFETQQINPTKKNRKPRPSFLEQIQDKWSLKTPSLRKKLPWQEQEQEQEQERATEPIEEEEEQRQQPSGVVASDSKIDRNSSESDLVSFGSGKNVILAPWVQKSKPRKPHSESEARNTRNSCDKGERVNGLGGHCEKGVSSSSFQESRNLKKEVNGNGKFEGVVKVDATPTGLAEKRETLTVKVDEGVSFNGEFSSIDEEIKVFESSSDKGRSTWKRESNVKRVEGDRLREMLPWERVSDVKSVEGDKLGRNTKLAEELIPEPELKRLRNVALRMVERIKVGAAGITQELMDSIHEKWKEDEVVKLKFEGPPAINMKRTHEILERRTGGLVIWRSGSSVVLFRGMAYKLHCVQSYAKQNKANMNISESSKHLVNDFTRRVGQNGSTSSLASSRTDLSKEQLMDLSELNLLLDELGPRFKDWSGRDPMPIDADLLPTRVPGYKRPFRLLPNGVRHGLRDKEMTFFRRTARTMPPHFALGRNRELQGLAMAMLKLWERSAIAKIAIKRGVQNTLNERMAEELKILTGGTLLSRNKDYIVFYRGNDFLPPGVTKALVEAQNLATLRQDEEDQARQKASIFIDSNAKAAKGPLVAGTLAETTAATSRWGNQLSNEERERMMRDSALARHASLVRYLEKKLSLANGKVKKAEKALEKVQEYLEPAELPTDLETLSDEERFLFRKIGLSMKPYLLLGRRGIFDGTIENMHLHWKYRELVKIIVKGKRFSQVKHIAISLEAESGGLLVSLDKTTKGYAIVVYRGKNYQRPCAFRPKNLLTKRQALARSIELQRREALKHHISELHGRIEKLKCELEDMKTTKEIDETLYSRVDNASDDDEKDDDDDLEEVEDEEAYLEIYDSSNED